ncbi:hypothetical protein D0Z00_003914, partial [Geotrichum galactomycetum]
NVPISEVGRFETEFLAHLRSSEPEILNTISEKGELSKELLAKLKDVTASFSAAFN